MSQPRNFWDERETIFLIETCIKVNFIKLLENAVTRNEHLYEILAQHFNKAGYNRTNNQIRTKFKNLKQLYRNAKLTNTKYRFDYYDLMDELYKQNNSVIVATTASSSQPSMPINNPKNTFPPFITKNNEEDDNNNNDDDDDDELFVDVIKNDTIDCKQIIEIDYDLVEYNYQSNTILNDICKDIEICNDSTTENLTKKEDSDNDENMDHVVETTNNTNDVHIAEISTDLIQTSLRNVSNGNIWSQYEIKALLELLIEENFMEIFMTSPRTEQLFKNISVKFLTEKGYHRSFEQIRNKFRNLKTTYHKFQNYTTISNNDEKIIVPLFYKEKFIELFSKFKFYDSDDSNDNQNNNNNKDEKKVYWTTNEIQNFIKIIINMDCINELLLKGKIGKPVNHQKIYESIALKHNENGIYNRSWQQLQSKLRKLNEDFIRVSADKSALPYYNLLKQLLQNDQKLENGEGLDTLEIHLLEENQNTIIQPDDDDVADDDDDDEYDDDDDYLVYNGKPMLEITPSTKRDIAMKDKDKNHRNFAKITKSICDMQMELQKHFLLQQQSLIDMQKKYELELQDRDDRRLNDFLIGLTAIIKPIQSDLIIKNSKKDINKEDIIKVDIKESIFNKMDTENNIKPFKKQSTVTKNDTLNTIHNLLKLEIENSTEYVIDKDEKVEKEDYDYDIEYYKLEQLNNRYDGCDDNDNIEIDNSIHNITTKTNKKLINVNDFDVNDNGFCSDNSDNSTDVDNHIKLQLLDPQQLKDALGCFMCSHISFSLRELRSHIRMHELCDLQCYECQLKFDDINSLNDHFQYHRKGNRSKLRELKKQSTNEKALCDICGIIRVSNTKILEHVKRHGSTAKRVYTECEICGKKLLTRSVRDHKLVHSSERPYKCEICGKAFRQSNVLRLHSKLHKERNIQCLICDKKFLKPIYLKYHMRRHDDDRPYKCDKCPKSYYSTQHLKTHSFSHFDEPQFQCEICNRQYKIYDSLKLHMYAHIGKPFICPFCGRGFTLRYKYKKHLLISHRLTNLVEINELLQCSILNN